mgnify:CR=1 FL=1
MEIVNDRTKYFDENNLEISQSKFNRIRSTNKLLDIPGDSVNHKKLTLREKRGKIKRQCTWEVTVSSKEESRQYYFATKEGFSQIMSTAIKDMIEFGKEAKYSKRSFESFL